MPWHMSEREFGRNRNSEGNGEFYLHWARWQMLPHSVATSVQGEQFIGQTFKVQFYAFFQVHTLILSTYYKHFDA